jgi:hypothetical protein
MKSLLAPLALVAGTAGALLVPALVAPDCPAQEKAAAAPKKVVRVHSLDGISSPSLPSSPVRDARGVAPFGWRDPEEELPQIEARDPGPTGDMIAEFVQQVVPPEMRDDVEIESDDGRLLVSAPEEVQRLLAGVLDALRRSVGAPFELDVRSVALSDGADGDALVAELAQCAGAVPDPLVRRLLAADRDHGSRGGSVAVHGGHPTMVEQSRIIPVVTDWDVEIAQASSIADPVPQAVEDGLRAEIAANGLPGGRAVVTMTAAAGEARLPFRRVEMRTRDLGAAEMPEVRAAFASGCALLAPGETAGFVLAAPTADGESTRRAILVRLVSSPPHADAAPIESVPVAGMTAPFHEPSLWFASPGYYAGSHERTSCVGFAIAKERHTIGGDDLLEIVRKLNWDAFGEKQNNVAFADAWAGGSFVAQGDSAWRAALRDAVTNVERDLLRAGRLDVRLVARGGDGAERAVGALAAPVLLDRRVSLAAYDAVSYVGDYDVEVAENARIAEPKPAAAVGGAVLNATVRRGAAGSVRVDFDLVVTSLGLLETAPVGASEVGVIERIPVRRAGVARSVVVEAGKAREIDLGPNPWSPPERGERLFAVVRAELAR